MVAAGLRHSSVEVAHRDPTCEHSAGWPSVHLAGCMYLGVEVCAAVKLACFDLPACAAGLPAGEVDAAYWRALQAAA